MFAPRQAIGFCSDPLPDNSGYTWTLTTKLGVLLSEAEQLYGPRDRSWTPLGIEFCGSTPKVWYPGNRRNVSIMLTESARTDPRRALFQLAHEVIHLLSPTGGKHAPVIEEGIATIFSHGVSQNFGLGFRSNKSRYLKAETLTHLLLATDPYAVRVLREKQPAFSQFTPELITEVYPNVDALLAVELCRPFSDMADS